MYQLSLYGPHAAAHWPCETLREASEKVYRWSEAIVSPRDTPEDWRVVIEQKDPDGRWTVVARYGGGLEPGGDHDFAPFGLGRLTYS